ncbi:unnamed protein product [Peronospora effusa]|nr:unnamed protein product [Peronospora effusa]
MERLLQTFNTKITASQSIQLFTARKEPKQSWPEHYLYLVSVSDACAGADQKVLDNIVHYASADRSTVLMTKYDNSRVDHLRQAEEIAHFAQSVEVESQKGRVLGRDVLAHVDEASTKKETHLVLAINDVGGKNKSPTPNGKRTDLVLAVEDANDKKCEWILDSGSSRHLVNDESLLEDARDCSHECNMADGETLSLSKVGSVRLCVMEGGKERTVKLTDVYLATQLERNIVSYGKLELEGFGLVYDGTPDDVLMAILFDEAMADSTSDTQSGTLTQFHQRLGHLSYDTVERMAKDPASGIKLTDRRRLKFLSCTEGKQTKNAQSRKDTSMNSPIDWFGGGSSVRT